MCESHTCCLCYELLMSCAKKLLAKWALGCVTVVAIVFLSAFQVMLNQAISFVCLSV